MIGCLPETLSINGREIPINADFRRALIVMAAFQDPELSDEEKGYIMLDSIIGIKNLNKEDYKAAAKECVWFLDGGHVYTETRKKAKLMDWEQDEQMIFSAVNNVAHVETRAQPFIHWWTFLGYFNEIREGLFSQVLLIRQKKAKGKKLDKAEQEFYNANQELVDLQRKYSKEEQDEIDYWNKMLGD